MITAPASKKDELLKNGSFNHRANEVTKGIFKRYQFFDANDIMQVKYEMLRAVEYEDTDISSASESFGFSRVSYYQIKKEFDEKGIAGLIPKKRGPKGSRKVSQDDIDFAKSLVDTHSKAQIITRLKEERGVEISKRTLERQLSDKKNS